jgi:transcriptional regulator with GAF, ATPase, and Fis domain
VGTPDPSALQAIVDGLARVGIDVDPERTGGQQVLPFDPCVVVFDALTPDVSQELRTAGSWGRERVIAIATSTAAFDSADAWSLLEWGASDVLVWDANTDASTEVAARLDRWSRVDQLLRSDVVRTNLVGRSPSWTSVLRQVVEVAAFTDTSILITGESGTGKELVARMVHALDPRPQKGQLVVVDCTTVVPTLSGSEFFGHERGAFTGAISARDGAFALANGGTLFLDEIGDLALPLQAELLRVIQEGMYKRVGSDTWRDTRFRLVCATNRSLEAAQARGEFRPDLYHRIAAWSCELPPLRDRSDDVVALAGHFLAELLGFEPEFDPAVTDVIAHREYQGNVRELRLLMGRIAARHVGEGPITVGDVPESERPRGRPDRTAWWRGPFDEAVGRAVALGVGLRDIGRLAQESAIASALAAEGGNLRKASLRLGVTDRALQLRRASQAATDPSVGTIPSRWPQGIAPRPRGRPKQPPKRRGGRSSGTSPAEH